MSRTIEDRFWAKVEPTGFCWIWTAAKTKGYGVCWNGERTMPAHRFAYEYLVGPIPSGLVIDHLCRNRACVNPDHMDVVTHRVNIRRGQAGVLTGAKQRAKRECPSGHEYDTANTYINSKGERSCRRCGRDRSRRWRAKTRQPLRRRGDDELDRIAEMLT